MKKTKRCSALLSLVIVIGFVGIFGAGCRSQPPGVATNDPAGEPVRITADELIDVFKDSNVFLLDVRGPEEIEEVGTVEGYTNIPIDELEARLDELPRDQPILTA